MLRVHFVPASRPRSNRNIFRRSYKCRTRTKFARHWTTFHRGRLNVRARFYYRVRGTTYPLKYVSRDDPGTSNFYARRWVTSSTALAPRRVSPIFIRRFAVVVRRAVRFNTRAKTESGFCLSRRQVVPSESLYRSRPNAFVSFTVKRLPVDRIDIER